MSLNYRVYLDKGNSGSRCRDTGVSSHTVPPLLLFFPSPLNFARGLAEDAEPKRRRQPQEKKRGFTKGARRSLQAVVERREWNPREGSAIEALHSPPDLALMKSFTITFASPAKDPV